MLDTAQLKFDNFSEEASRLFILFLKRNNLKQRSKNALAKIKEKSLLLRTKLKTVLPDGNRKSQ